MSARARAPRILMMHAPIDPPHDTPAHIDPDVLREILRLIPAEGRSAFLDILRETIWMPANGRDFGFAMQIPSQPEFDALLARLLRPPPTEE